MAIPLKGDLSPLIGMPKATPIVGEWFSEHKKKGAMHMLKAPLRLKSFLLVG